MPIYEYFCPNCRNKFELLRPISKAEDDSECPKCKTASKRAISKFVSRAKDDMGFLNHMPASTGSSCSGCTSTNCSSCGH